MQNLKTTLKTTITWLVCLMALSFMSGCGSDKDGTNNVCADAPEHALPTAEERQLDVARNLMTQPGEVIMLSCDGGYQGVVRYFAPDSEGLLSRMALIMFKDDKAVAYDMVSVVSASGAKFSTQEADYVMWEAKGEFSFYRGDAETLLATCRKIPRSETQEQKMAVIELDGNPTTGYTWVYTLSPEGVIREVSNEYAADKTDERVVGSGGKFIFTFEAVGKGEADIVFSYLRTWEEGTPALETVVYKATVDDEHNLRLIQK